MKKQRVAKKPAVRRKVKAAPDSSQPVRFRGRVVEAMRYTGENADGLLEWAGDGLWLTNAGRLSTNAAGTREASPGDWVVKGAGGFTVIADEMFEAAMAKLLAIPQVLPAGVRAGPGG